MKISDAGLSLIRTFEGLRTSAYKCPAGIWTIGYGHTSNVTKDMLITQKEAECLLLSDLAYFEKAVTNLVKEGSCTQSQFDALVCFAFNVGVGSLAASTLLKKFKAGDIQGAADEFLRWNKAASPDTRKKIEVKGLTLRRQAERRLFLSEL